MGSGLLLEDYWHYPNGGLCRGLEPCTHARARRRGVRGAVLRRSALWCCSQALLRPHVGLGGSEAATQASCVWVKPVLY